MKKIYFCLVFDELSGVVHGQKAIMYMKLLHMEILNLEMATKTWVNYNKTYM